MSFIGAVKKGSGYDPGFFLAHEECVRETMQIAPANVTPITTEEGGKYAAAGDVYVDGEGNPIGFLYEDVDITNGNMPGSVVTSGVIDIDRLGNDQISTDETYRKQFEDLGFKFVKGSVVERPY